MTNAKGFHESPESLQERTRDLHRALESTQEELEAVDWYRQRADACSSPELRDILLHNMREEIEHAAMLLEWLRRNDSSFDAHLRTYLFTDRSILAVEEGEEGEEGKGDGDNGSGAEPKPNVPTIGSMMGDAS